MGFTGKATFDNSELPDLVDDVSDLVGLIAPFDTPLLDAIGSPRWAARSTRHEWDGGENFTQIFTDTVTISGSMDAVGLHAVEREFDYQVIQRLRELMRSLEQTVICGFKSGENRRAMGGILQFSESYDAAGAEITDKLLQSELKKCSQSGRNTTAIVCNGFQKRKIGSFIQSNRRYEPESAAVRNVVDVYESDFGVQRVIQSRWVPSDKILLLDLDKLQVMPLQGRSFFVKPLAESGDFRKAQLIGEYTLESTATHGVISGLATS